MVTSARPASNHSSPVLMGSFTTNGPRIGKGSFRGESESVPVFLGKYTQLPDQQRGSGSRDFSFMGPFDVRGQTATRRPIGAGGQTPVQLSQVRPETGLSSSSLAKRHNRLRGLKYIGQPNEGIDLGKILKKLLDSCLLKGPQASISDTKSEHSDDGETFESSHLTIQTNYDEVEIELTYSAESAKSAQSEASFRAPDYLSPASSAETNDPSPRHRAESGSFF